MMLHYGENDRGIQLAEEGDDKTLRAHCYLKKARVLRAAKVAFFTAVPIPSSDAWVCVCVCVCR